ncbi:TorF family putative porin [Sandaracinobacter sp. RS1-74]|uniref:TorF family putative porin n=1 Tax=Sandaracinobacteroides sayramensis TaxID=2913411 RepID=UPI001EDA50F0|nr:TorF family putative porin [Sandaracinobacteroides sayramensis]MCG2839912.1 TorF family putative porin [Sandaracinobacteroides sayramensis]
MKAVSSIGSRAVLAGILMLGASTAALAQEEEKSITISGSAAFVSDYRWRGGSLSNLDPAVQAGITLEHKSGFFVGAWGSSIADFNGSTVEVDLTAGWAGNVAGLEASGGVLYYGYPGGKDTDMVELFGTIGVPLGPVTATFGLNWAPDQSNLDRSSRYAFGQLSAGIPNTPISLTASLGNERGGVVADESGLKTSKWDWLVGADLTWEALTFSVAYVGNDLTGRTISDGESSFRANRLAKDTVVFSVTAAF